MKIIRSSEEFTQSGAAFSIGMHLQEKHVFQGCVLDFMSLAATDILQYSILHCKNCCNCVGCHDHCE